MHCYLGMVLHATGKSAQALDMLERASLMEPRNPQVRPSIQPWVARQIACGRGGGVLRLESVRPSFFFLLMPYTNTYA